MDGIKAYLHIDFQRLRNLEVRDTAHWPQSIHEWYDIFKELPLGEEKNEVIVTLSMTTHFTFSWLNLQLPYLLFRKL